MITGKFVSQGIDFCIHEFFILRYKRRQGIGKQAIEKVLEQMKGTFEVAQLTNNQPACNFWKSFYTEQNIEYIEQVERFDGLECFTQHFRNN